MPLKFHLISRNLKCILLTFLLVFSWGLKGTAIEKWESWTFIGIDTKIKNSELSIHNANFFHTDYGWFLNHTQITYDFFTHKKWFIGLGYKQEYVQFSEKWRKEYRPFFRLFYQKKFTNWEIEDRSQYEMRFIEGELINRFRNQISVAYTKSDKIIPFFSTEFFVNLDNMRYNRQRIFFGLALPVGSFEFLMFTGPEINRFPLGTWRSKYILGTGISYGF